MRDETEQAILSDLESQTPSMGAEFEQTLRDLARLAQFIQQDATSASNAAQEDREDALRQIDEKAQQLSNWLLRKADECRDS